MENKHTNEDIDTQLQQLDQEEQAAIAAINQQHEEATKNEEIDPVVIERQQKLETIKKGLLAIIEEQKSVIEDLELLRRERDVLLDEQDQEDPQGEEVEEQAEPEIATPVTEEKKESHLQQEVSEIQNSIQALNEQITQYEAKIDDKSKDILKHGAIVDQIPVWKLWKFRTLNKASKDKISARNEQDALWSKLTALSKTRADLYEKLEELSPKLYREEKNKEEKREREQTRLDVARDKEQNQFAYFVAEKAIKENPYLETVLANNTANVCDLRWADKSKESLLLGTRQVLKYTGDEEGFFDFSAFGFAKIIKNVEELKTKDGIDSGSPRARYKIIGPGDTLIADDLDYEKAEETFTKSIREYKQEVENEYNNTLQ